MRKYFTLVFIPHRRARAVTIGGPFILLCAVVTCLLLALVAWNIGSTYVASVFDVGKLTALEQRNIQLRARIRAMERQAGRLQQHMAELVKRDQAARVVVDLPDIPPEIRQVGVGGPAGPPTTFDARDSSGALAVTVKQDLSRLLREIRLEYASYQSIISKAETNQQYWCRIPTIRPSQGWLTSGFGLRKDPITGYRRMHRGVDIGAQRGEEVYATADGVVATTGWDAKYGRYIDIDHQNGFKTRYGHLDEITAERGASVRRGEQVGLIGRTGRATGYHLHYEVRRYDRVVDPMTYFYPENLVVN